jgi:glycosyltransferase involved in cell wall biosynthesis
MKVFVIGTRGFPGVQGGVEKHCEELFPRLVGLGAEVTALTRTPYLKKPYKREWQGVKYVNLWCPRKKSLEVLFHTFFGVFIAKVKSPDILHCNAIGPSLLIPLVRLLRLKVVMTHHGPDYERAKWGWLAKKVLRLGEKWGCKYADEIIAISSGIKKLVKEKFEREAYLIPNGVIIPKRSDKTDYIEKAGLIPEKYILSVARFVPEKGLHDLISAFSKLNTDWKLAIAGDADHETAYSKNLKEIARRTPGVILTGFVTGSPLEELYSHASLFVLPSYHEGLPIALLEALSYGLSVVVSDIPPNREVTLPEERYFKVGDSEDLAKKIDIFLKTGLNEKERQAQIQLVKERYDWDHIARETYRVYCSL